MNPVAQAAAGLAALIHVVFFVMESLVFSRPSVYRRFHLSAGDAKVVQPMAFNQGFYNLALAAGVVGGLIAVQAGSPTVGRTLILFSTGCMALAGVVLACTDRRLLRAAAIQAGPPLVVFVSAFL